VNLLCRARTAALAVCLLATPAMIASTVGAQADIGAGEAVSWLERRVGLAESGQFYLVLDPAASSLALSLGGVTLLELPVSGLTVLTPRVLFRRAGAPVGWQDATWLHGTLDPPLPVVGVVPPPSGDTETAVTTPLLPDELVPAPDRYDIRFEGGLALRVVTAAAGTPRGAGLAAAARERWRVLRGVAPDAVLVRLLMAPEDAGRFYRALPPDVALILAPRDAAPTEP
jgi:hypothetical protein